MAFADPAILEALKPWKKEVDEQASKKIGKTRVLLDSNCRYRECNLGNLITDAMVDAVRKILFFDRPPGRTRGKIAPGDTDRVI